MSNVPEVKEEINGWRMLRWGYDKAPLMAEHPRDKWTVEIDDEGDLVFDGLPYDGARPYVPMKILIRLIDDARERNVLPKG